MTTPSSCDTPEKDVAKEAEAQVQKLSVEEQIAFWRKMSDDVSVTASARITAYTNLVTLIGDSTENTVKYVIEMLPFEEKKNEKTI